MPVVELDVKTVKVLLAPGGDGGDEFLGLLSGLFGRQHDRRAVRVVGTDKVHLIALHALEAHPDVGLDVLHDVADVKCAVSVGQGGGGKDAAVRHCSM